MLSNQWTLPDCYPTGDIPSVCALPDTAARRPTCPAHVLQAFLDATATGEAQVPIGHVYRLDEIQEAHRAMEANTAGEARGPHDLHLVVSAPDRLG